jgi:hypothetical protein
MRPLLPRPAEEASKRERGYLPAVDGIVREAVAAYRGDD